MARPAEDLFLFTRDQVRSLDRLAIDEFGIPGIVLMENAARHAADVALDGVEGEDDPAALIVCGPGNNGGDGLAVARHLHNAGLDVSIVLLGHPEPGTDAAIQLDIARRMHLPIRHAEGDDAGQVVLEAARALGGPSVIIDAIFGTGLSRAPAGAGAGAIAAINQLASDTCPVLAIDCPSGMNVDTGEPLGECVRASVTVTFAGLKPGFLSLDAQGWLGEVIVADIGAPRELLARIGTRLSALANQEPRGLGGEESIDAEPPPRQRRRG
ncbi:MAG: NAD(P)H-hydrate epimerase [Tepidisphaera sp.]|nr:NAD(P)H-hydrate epimerase [Tepidisphaera sp.]